MGLNDVPEIYIDKVKQRIPSGRFCNPEEVLSTIKYLISTEYVNGSNIEIDGGIN
jgi:NAD(P)-dependent dehydrogenase (short-subunit alcohol dehydrogenase family)